MPDALRLAIGTLTRLPVPAPQHIDRRTAGWAMSLSPVVALVLAAICGLPLLITQDRPAFALLIAIVSFALLAWATRALHLDGLADTADALGSGKPAAAALEIARKSDIGPFGVITLIFTLLLQIAAVASLPDAHDAYFAFVIAIVTSRVALTWACTRMWPAARPDGLGAVVAATVPLLVAIAWTIITIALAWIFVGIAGGVSVVLGILAGIVLLVIARRRLGGMTGDVLGATIEMTATTALLVLALIA
jgi:adenosylcobinamide-GDP ribazoletransferase